LNDLALPVGATEQKIVTEMNVNRDAMKYVTPDKIDWNSAKAEQNNFEGGKGVYVGKQSESVSTTAVVVGVGAVVLLAFLLLA